MPTKFNTKEQRNELAMRLINLAGYMQRSFDQGRDGRIPVTDEMICDILAAAGVVGLAEIGPH